MEIFEKKICGIRYSLKEKQVLTELRDAFIEYCNTICCSDCSMRDECDNLVNTCMEDLFNALLRMEGE